MSNYVIKHESDASEIKNSLRELGDKGLTFPASLRKVGISEFEWGQMELQEQREFMGAWLLGVPDEEKYLY